MSSSLFLNCFSNCPPAPRVSQLWTMPLSRETAKLRLDPIPTGSRFRSRLWVNLSYSMFSFPFRSFLLNERHYPLSCCNCVLWYRSISGVLCSEVQMCFGNSLKPSGWKYMLFYLQAGLNDYSQSYWTFFLFLSFACFVVMLHFQQLSILYSFWGGSNKLKSVPTYEIPEL